LQDFLNFI